MKKKAILSLPVIVLTGIGTFQFFFNSVDTVNRSKNKWEWVETKVSTEANAFFWQQFHLGNYDSIPAILERLTVAYLENPNDLQAVYHLGFTHFWAIAERQNLEKIPGILVEHAVLAQKYLGEAYRLNPDDARTLSFLSAAKIMVGAISDDEKLVADGYLNGLKAIREWEDFSEFSLAYTLGRLPYTDPNFQKSLDLIKSTVERCYCENSALESEACIRSISKIPKNPKGLGKKRVVHNTWVAPHNIEGFFMAYGDLLVKNGDWEKGREAYEFARHSPDFKNWDYRDILEKRIRDARNNVSVFRKEIPSGEKVAVDEAIMVQTSISCTACHQMGKRDMETRYRNFDSKAYLDKPFYFLGG